MASEPSIIINGEALTIAEAMTLRVALMNFMMELEDPDCLGSDDTGRALVSSYRVAARRLASIMMRS